MRISEGRVLHAGMELWAAGVVKGGRKRELSQMVHDRSAQFMGISVALLFSFVLALNALAF